MNLKNIENKVRCIKKDIAEWKDKTYKAKGKLRSLNRLLKNGNVHISSHAMLMYISTLELEDLYNAGYRSMEAYIRGTTTDILELYTQYIMDRDGECDIEYKGVKFKVIDYIVVTTI